MLFLGGLLPLGFLVARHFRDERGCKSVRLSTTIPRRIRCKVQLTADGDRGLVLSGWLSLMFGDGKSC